LHEGIAAPAADRPDSTQAIREGHGGANDLGAARRPRQPRRQPLRAAVERRPQTDLVARGLDLVVPDTRRGQTGGGWIRQRLCEGALDLAAGGPDPAPTNREGSGGVDGLNAMRRPRCVLATASAWPARPW
jgi:hypothetical protein